MHKVGERVGAILSGDEKAIKFLGFGEYVGEEVPPADTGGFGSMIHVAGLTNAKIKLDNGKIVWGCECWWGGEEAVKKELEVAKSAGKQIVEIDMDTYRNESK